MLGADLASAFGRLGETVYYRFGGFPEDHAELVTDYKNDELFLRVCLTWLGRELVDWRTARLMGSDVEPRKRFIQTHAKSVRNLDI